MTITPLPWFPVYGTGAPGGSVPKNAQYFDTGTTPYTPYLYSAGAWHEVGGGGSSGSGDASQLQSRAISNAPPSNGDVLRWNAGTSMWEPSANTSGAPTIVQSAGNAGGSINTCTLPAPPTKGNLLICFVSHFSNSLNANNPLGALSHGWASYAQVNGSSRDGTFCLYKIVSAGDTALQTPFSSTSDGSIAIWELSNVGGGLIDAYSEQNNAAGATVWTQPITTTVANTLILSAFTNTNNTTQPTSLQSLTQDQAVAAGGRALTMGHLAAPTAGVYNPGITFAGAQQVAAMSISIV